MQKVSYMAVDRAWILHRANKGWRLGSCLEVAVAWRFLYERLRRKTAGTSFYTSLVTGVLIIRGSTVLYVYYIRYITELQLNSFTGRSFSTDKYHDVSVSCWLQFLLKMALNFEIKVEISWQKPFQLRKRNFSIK